MNTDAFRHPCASVFICGSNSSSLNRVLDAATLWLEMDPRAKHRLLLSLRSEKAFGLKSISGVPELVDHPVAQAEITSDPEPARVPSRAPIRSPVSVQEPAVPAKKKSEPAPMLVSAPSAEPFSSPVVSTAKKKSLLIEMNSKEVSVCTKCRLCETRTNTVFGEGDVDAKIFFIGEGPGENEDLQGRPFVGRAGQLLDKMILAMGLSREKVFIANIVKCRPPDNRVPMPDEVATCTPYLERQLEIVRPEVIVTLGRPATTYMLGNPKLTMGAARGRWHEWRGIKLMPTFHPSYVLRSYTPETRKAVWSDLQLVLKELGLPLPKRSATE